MPVTLGLDIGSNSVGSAWVDTDAKEITLGVSVFPAGVDVADQKLGDPKNKARRDARSLRRSLARRAQRKHRLRRLLTECDLLPRDAAEVAAFTQLNPWHLRRKALAEPLTPHEFGRLLIHLNQRRGALGVETGSDDDAEGKVKEAIEHTRTEMAKANAQTFGQMMADQYDQRQQPVSATGKMFRSPIRNRFDAFEFHADRGLIREEFAKLWEKQKSFGGQLATLLTENLRRRLDDPADDETWRHRGEIFGQRRTYWKTGTLGRCDLEPSDHRCPHADMYAQEFRVLETVNNLRVTERGSSKRQLGVEEREKVVAALRKQKTAKLSTVKKALGIKKATNSFYEFSVEDKDPDRDFNTDWFYREVIHGVFTEEGWNALTDGQRDAVNRSILKFAPAKPEHAERLKSGAQTWWRLSADAAGKLVEAWRNRPHIEKRMSLSRRAIFNLLPYMRCKLTEIEARQAFAEDESNAATPIQRVRYAHTISDTLREMLVKKFGDEATARLLQTRGSTKADRHYLRKHDDPLPPAPMLANPVVRKAIHEVRRHVLAYWRKFGRKPDRIVIELAREAKQSERVRNERLSANRARENERKAIIKQFTLNGLTLNQQRKAVDRVLLCRQQRGVCVYSNLDADNGHPITEEQAAQPDGDVEIDHIVPRSRSQDNSLNNKVLCLRNANRNKGNRTVKEWLAKEQFERLLQRFAQWKTDQPRKWENLTCDALELDKFVASQLTDTAYAARQVGDFLRSALYADDSDHRQRIFFTNGRNTSQLRRDWQLQDDAGPKERKDHRHHAIDAAVIALTSPERLHALARSFDEKERARTTCDNWPKRNTLPPPWGTVDNFRTLVLGAADSLIVSHRPVKRKLAGSLHKENPYGAVLTQTGIKKTRFTKRERADLLKPKHLRLPGAWDELDARLHDASTTRADKRQIRAQMAGLMDEPPKKGGIVRDRELRCRIRRCLRDKGIDPDNFKKDEIKRLVSGGHLRMPSGVPIKRVVLLRTINDPVLIPRKEWDATTQQYVCDDDPRTMRAYDSQNNHHIEIRENEKTGRWSGEVVRNFDAARRNANRLSELKKAGVPQGVSWRMLSKLQRAPWRPVIADINQRFPIVDRRDDQGIGGRFIMSLAEEEVIHMRHPKTEEPDYFVVFKLDKRVNKHSGKRMGVIQLLHHWDARDDKPRRGYDGNVIPDSNRKKLAVPVALFKDLGPERGTQPYKVRISPLGEIQRLERD